MSSGKSRLDVALVERGLFDSREKARRAVMAAQVFVDGQPATKAGTLIPALAKIEVAAKEKFVGRGGYKIEAALEAFRVDPAGRVCADIGASTGGFTDCLLQRGAARVYAVDVGYGQLDDKLRRDPRVVALERTNARHLEASHFAEPVDLVVVDASFIGLAQLAPAIARIVRPDGSVVALVKPQFEAGREAASRGRGVIRDEGVREAAIAGARQALTTEGLTFVAEIDSGVPGPKGNVERFVWARRA
ncbi:MAG: TlyA family RNA methyltransferase [Verrucomicrobiota bacterium]